MARNVAGDCQTVRILDADGTPLTLAMVLPIDDGAGGEIELADVDEPGTLMNYYFGRGERLVVVELDGRTREGFLDTRWQSDDRVWWVQLTPISIVRIGGRSRLDPVDAPEREERPELSHAEPLRVGL